MRGVRREEEGEKMRRGEWNPMHLWVRKDKSG